LPSFACWANKTTDAHTHSDYVILLAFRTMVTRTPLGVMFVLIVLPFMTGFNEAFNKVPYFSIDNARVIYTKKV